MRFIRISLLAAYFIFGTFCWYLGLLHLVAIATLKMPALPLISLATAIIVQVFIMWLLLKWRGKIWQKILIAVLVSILPLIYAYYSFLRERQIELQYFERVIEHRNSQ